MTDANDAVQPPEPPTYQPPAEYSAPAQPPYGQVPYGQAPVAHPTQPPYGQAPVAHQTQPPYGQAPVAHPTQPPYGQPSYGQPPYGQPPYGQPPYGQAPYGYPAPAVSPYGYAPISGRRYWAMLFLTYIPYVGAIVAAIVAIVQRSSAMRSPHPIVRENARWAANWAISYALYLIALIVVLITIGVGTSRPRYYDDYGYSSYSSGPSGWIALPGLLLFGIGIYCLVTIIMGTVTAERKIHRPVLAIPFFRV